MNAVHYHVHVMYTRYILCLITQNFWTKLNILLQSVFIKIALNNWTKLTYERIVEKHFVVISHYNRKYKIDFSLLYISAFTKKSHGAHNYAKPTRKEYTIWVKNNDNSRNYFATDHRLKRSGSFFTPWISFAIQWPSTPSRYLLLPPCHIGILIYYSFQLVTVYFVLKYS